MAVATSLSLTARPADIEQVSTVRVDLPADYWEVAAILAQDDNDESRDLSTARGCLMRFGGLATDPQIDILDGRAILKWESPQGGYILDRSAGWWKVSVSGANLRIRVVDPDSWSSSSATYDGGTFEDAVVHSPVRWEGTVNLDGLSFDELRPLPDSTLRQHRVTWATESAAADQPNGHATVKLPLDRRWAYVVASSREAKVAEWADTEITLRWTALNSVLIAISATIVTLAAAVASHAARKVLATTVAVVGLCITVLIGAYSITGYFSTCLYAALITGVAALLLRGKLLLLPSLAGLSTICIALKGPELYDNSLSVGDRVGVMTVAILACISLATGVWFTVGRARHAAAQGLLFGISPDTAMGALGVLLGFAFAYAIGATIGDPNWTRAYPWSNALISVGAIGLNGSPVLLASICVVAVLGVADVERRTAFASKRAVPLLAAVFALVAGWSTTMVFGFATPIGLLLLWCGMRLLTRPQTGEPIGESPRSLLRRGRATALLDRQELITTERARAGEIGVAEMELRLLQLRRQRDLFSETERGGLPASASLFCEGPCQDWLDNGRAAVRLGSWFGLVPLAYFAWVTIDTLGNEVLGQDVALGFAFALVAQALRWLGLSFVYGSVYALLPGRAGPTKAACLSGVISVPVLLGLLGPVGSSEADASAVIFALFQVFVFLEVLAVGYDLETLRGAGGSWNDIQDLYGFGRFQSIAVYIAPVLVSVVLLGQQVLAGSGIDFVTTALDTVSKLPA